MNDFINRNPDTGEVTPIRFMVPIEDSWTMDLKNYVPSETEEVEFCVNLYWELHYRNDEGVCRICLNDGLWQADWGIMLPCICPEGMKRRKQQKESK